MVSNSFSIRGFELFGWAMVFVAAVEAGARRPVGLRVSKAEEGTGSVVLGCGSGTFAFGGFGGCSVVCDCGRRESLFDG